MSGLRSESIPTESAELYYAGKHASPDEPANSAHRRHPATGVLARVGVAQVRTDGDCCAGKEVKGTAWYQAKEEVVGDKQLQRPESRVLMAGSRAQGSGASRRERRSRWAGRRVWRRRRDSAEAEGTLRIALLNIPRLMQFPYDGVWYHSPFARRFIREPRAAGGDDPRARGGKHAAPARREDSRADAHGIRAAGGCVGRGRLLVVASPSFAGPTGPRPRHGCLGPPRTRVRATERGRTFTIALVRWTWAQMRAACVPRERVRGAHQLERPGRVAGDYAASSDRGGGGEHEVDELEREAGDSGLERGAGAPGQSYGMQRKQSCSPATNAEDKISQRVQKKCQYLPAEVVEDGERTAELLLGRVDEEPLARGLELLAREEDSTIELLRALETTEEREDEAELARDDTLDTELAREVDAELERGAEDEERIDAELLTREYDGITELLRELEETVLREDGPTELLRTLLDEAKERELARDDVLDTELLARDDGTELLRTLLDKADERELSTGGVARHRADGAEREAELLGRAEEELRAPEDERDAGPEEELRALLALPVQLLRALLERTEEEAAEDWERDAELLARDEADDETNDNGLGHMRNSPAELRTEEDLSLLLAEDERGTEDEELRTLVERELGGADDEARDTELLARDEYDDGTIHD
ncbi:hypothetical protein B0H15DRAFT_805434 [Mycena belliarum]|uniref:Uncharacterized protein n=1 Tax=Mycena belliarum TaxID=1033014 RepID=A0AAD6TRH1_9AGAR|nr:hypothetical protein B0H15DRAFT_805434 [Mycena belliae]